MWNSQLNLPLIRKSREQSLRRKSHGEVISQFATEDEQASIENEEESRIRIPEIPEIPEIRLIRKSREQSFRRKRPDVESRKRGRPRRKGQQQMVILVTLSLKWTSNGPQMDLK